MNAILLSDTSGRKYEYAMKRFVLGATPHSPINVLTGELLVDYFQEGQPFNYQVYNDPTILLYCEADNVSPLGKEEFLLLEAISRPADRMEAFRHQMDFGMVLKEGSRVTVTLPAWANISHPTGARAFVHYKGKVGNQPGTMFGVEILDKTKRREKPGVSDGTFQNHRYFTCEDGHGLFVSLRWLSPADSDTALDRVDRRRGDKPQPSYSEVQSTRSSGKPLHSKVASTDGSPSEDDQMKTASRDATRPAAPSKGKTSESSADPVSSRFVKGQRVMFYNVYGVKHYGRVGWIGNQSSTRLFHFTIVGIRTENVIYKSDYDSVIGLDHLMREAPPKHALFLPEAFVEPIPEGATDLSSQPTMSESSRAIAGVVKISDDSLMKQAELLEKYKTLKQDKLMEAADDSVDLKNQLKLQQSEVRAQENKPVCRDQGKDMNNTGGGQNKLPPNKTQPESPAHNLKVGSPVQLPAVDGSVKYGTIRWMGHVPSVSVEIAGLEMDDSIKGCTDGTFQATGQQFFVCSPGKGLYYPLKNLVPVDDCHLKQLYLQLKRENVSLTDLQAESQQRINVLKRENSSLTSIQSESQQRINELTNTLLLTQPFFSIAELNTVSRAEIERIPKKRIGFGAWGEVYSARFRGEDVAIKIAHREILRQSADMLKREIQIMSSVQHPNLVRFIGAVLDDAVEQKVDTPIIISELMDMNLRAAYERKLDLSGSLMSIFRDVAYALQYLHQHREPIIHRDISAPNVLLKSLPGGSYRAKVSDFGSANLVKNSTTAAAGAIIYSAPEMFPSEGIAAQHQLPKQTPKVDVYSYGILLLEVIAKEMPSQDTSYDLLQTVKGQWSTMYELIVHCTKRSPSDRPTMADILKQLNSALH